MDDARGEEGEEREEEEAEEGGRGDDELNEAAGEEDDDEEDESKAGMVGEAGRRSADDKRGGLCCTIEPSVSDGWAATDWLMVVRPAVSDLTVLVLADDPASRQCMALVIDVAGKMCRLNASLNNRRANRQLPREQISTACLPASADCEEGRSMRPSDCI